MAKAVKKHGRVYTPNYIVNLILDFGGYNTQKILRKNIIDNSCGDGAFLAEITNRYCLEFLKKSSDKNTLKNELQNFIHGIELDEEECNSCISNLNQIAIKYGLTDINWDILNANTLSIHQFDKKMDYVFGNPPYVRVHNLDENYDAVKEFRFADGGMTDLFIVFFEIGFNMLAPNGQMCLITPSSWLSSLAGLNLRKHIQLHKNLSGIIDLEHFQAFDATTYTLISFFKNSGESNFIEYHTFNGLTKEKHFEENLNYTDISIGNNFYFSKKEKLSLLRNIKIAYSYPYVSVKNGFATLADKIFIGDFEFDEGTINILKASTSKWSKCIYPYDKNGKPLSIDEFKENKAAFEHLLSHKEKLAKNRDISNNDYWYLFGRTQALKDVFKTKYAINTIIKDKESIKLEVVPQGCGIYSGLYILTEIEFDTIQQLIYSEDFISYIKILKNYKSGGYYTFSSKDLEQYLNFKLTEIYGQSRISNNRRELF